MRSIEMSKEDLKSQDKSVFDSEEDLPFDGIIEQ